MSKKSGMGKFILGAGIGAGLALLFAPQEGSKTRKELKDKLAELYEKAKQIDVEDVKADVLQRVEELRMQVKDLDKEKALDIAKSQAKKIEKKANELYDIAKEKSAPVVEKAAKEVKETALKAAKEVVSRLETEEKKPTTKKKTKVKKSI
jgi:gas vesicle protein